MFSITVQIDYGQNNGGVIAYYFESQSGAPAVIAQAIHDGFLTVPSGAKNSTGRVENTDVHYPLHRVVSVS